MASFGRFSDSICDSFCFGVPGCFLTIVYFGLWLNDDGIFRESKLTRILQDSLGGGTKACIIATVSPAQSAIDVSVFSVFRGGGVFGRFY